MSGRALSARSASFRVVFFRLGSIYSRCFSNANDSAAAGANSKGSHRRNTARGPAKLLRNTLSLIIPGPSSQDFADAKALVGTICGKIGARLGAESDAENSQVKKDPGVVGPQAGKVFFLSFVYGSECARAPW